jgi:hypothetical protein
MAKSVKKAPAKKGAKKAPAKKAPAKKAAKKSAKKTSKKKSSKKSKKPTKKKSKKKAKRVSIIARGRLAKSQVYKGKKAHTSGGLKKSSIIKNKNGKYVSKKKSAASKGNKWIKSVAAAKKQLGIKGFQVIGGKTAKGQQVLKLARSIHKK